MTNYWGTTSEKCYKQENCQITTLSLKYLHCHLKDANNKIVKIK